MVKKELEQRLEDEFPFMRRGKSINEQKDEKDFIYSLYDAFGCDVGDGWFEVLRGLCRDITEAYRRAGLPVDIVVDQVKEKYGGLCFYYHHDNNVSNIYTFDLPSNGQSIEVKQKVFELHKEIEEIVNKWEEMSGNVCEDCGATGKVREDLNWVLTLCDLCYEKLLRKLERNLS